MNDVKRLALVGCGLIVMVSFCLFIKNHADTEGWKRAYKYNIAITAKDKDHFNYDVDSHQGLVLSRGQFTSKGAKFDEMNKRYTYVDKVHEHYTMHTREVCSGSGDDESCHTETYYTWDIAGSEEKYADKVTYFGRSYNPSIFGFHSFVNTLNACDVTPPDTSGFFESKKGCKKEWGGDYYYTGNDDRYYYNAVPLTFTASFLTDTSDGNLKSPFKGKINLEDKSTEQMVKDASGYKVTNNFILVTMAIIMLIFGGILGYNWVMADGKWSLYE